MTAAVSSVLTDIATTWAALTPPDRPEDTYAELSIRRSFGGNRTFYFDPPERTEPISEAGSTATQVEWLIVARVRLDEVGRPMSEMARAAANEADILMRAIDERTSWTSSAVWSVISDDVTHTRADDNKNDIEMTLTFRALCAED